MCKRDEYEVKHAGCYSNNREHTERLEGSQGGERGEDALSSVCVAEKLQLLNEHKADLVGVRLTPLHQNQWEPTSPPGWGCAPCQAHPGARQGLGKKLDFCPLKMRRSSPVNCGAKQGWVTSTGPCETQECVPQYSRVKGGTSSHFFVGQC